MVTKLLLPAIVALSLLALPPDSAQSRVMETVNTPAQRELDVAFASSYNLDHADALAHARRAVAMDPNSSAIHRGLASIIWVQLLFQRGAMTVDNYLGGITLPPFAVPTASLSLVSEFRGALARAIELSDRQLKKSPDDLDAMFDAGAAYGIQASYMASIDGGLTSAFRFARRAFETHNDLIVRDPSRASAGLIVGTYRYLIATQPAYIRLFAYLVGFSGDKEKAIALLEGASHDSISRVDAKTALVLIYSREGRHNEALRLTRELGIELPRNRLFQLEEGAAAIRAGKAGEAEAALTRGLEAFDKDMRAKIPGEQALWLYKRGLARLNLDHSADSGVDLRRALTLGPIGWVEGRIHVALGKLADLAGRRAEATSEYGKAQVVCQKNPDETCLNEARQYLRLPFHFDR